MNFFTDNMLIIIIFPIIVGILSLFAHIFKYSFSNKAITVATILSNLTGLLFSVFIFKYITFGNVQDIEYSINWFKTGNFNFTLGLYADKLSSVFLLALTVLCFAIHYYFSVYMSKDKKYRLYTAFLNFLQAGVISLILSSNIIQTYILGEIVCVFGYLLININFENTKISNSAKNFLVLNKIGDILMLIGIVIFVYFLVTYPIYEGSSMLLYSDFTEIASDFYVYLSDTWFYIACMLLFGGIISKTAQIPLHFWVINSAKAPIPICALLLSSVIAGGGIFFALRLLPLFELSVSVMNTILYIGLITALFCAFFAVGQNNIKKMLSYSSSSQLGLMIAAIGLNLPAAAVMYFLSHIFAKSVLLLSAGNLYKLSGEQNFNISDFNASRKDFPVLAYCYFICAVSLSGLFFGGAAANDEMIKACSASMQISALIIFLLTCFITAYYIFRSYFLIFERKTENTNDYSAFLNLPVVFLTLFVAAVTFLPLNIFEFFDRYAEVPRELIPGNLKYLLTYGIILIGGFLGAYISMTNKNALPKFLMSLSSHGCFAKRIYAIFTDNILEIFKNFAKNFDKYVLKWFFNLFEEITKWISWIISVIQNGNIQTYISLLFLTVSLSIGGIVLILLILRGII